MISRYFLLKIPMLKLFGSELFKAGLKQLLYAFFEYRLKQNLTCSKMRMISAEDDHAWFPCTHTCVAIIASILRTCSKGSCGTKQPTLRLFHQYIGKRDVLVPIGKFTNIIDDYSNQKIMVKHSDAYTALLTARHVLRLSNHL